MMYGKNDIKQFQAVLTDEEKTSMQAAVLQSGMKQKYWVRKAILEAIAHTSNETEIHMEQTIPEYIEQHKEEVMK